MPHFFPCGPCAMGNDLLHSGCNHSLRRTLQFLFHPLLNPLTSALGGIGWAIPD